MGVFFLCVEFSDRTEFSISIWNHGTLFSLWQSYPICTWFVEGNPVLSKQIWLLQLGATETKKVCFPPWIQYFCSLIWALQSLLALESRRRGGWLQNHRAEAEKPRCTALKAGKQEEAEAEQAGADAWEARRRTCKDRIRSQECWNIWGNCRIVLGSQSMGANGFSSTNHVHMG